MNDDDRQTILRYLAALKDEHTALHRYIAATPKDHRTTTERLHQAAVRVGELSVDVARVLELHRPLSAAVAEWAELDR